MRFGFRATVVALLSLLSVIACVAGDNQCLNPQPDLPSCRGFHGPGSTAGGSSGVVTGNGDNTETPSPPEAVGGRASTPGVDIGMDASAPASAGSADQGADGGAGGESATESAGAGGAAGSDDAPWPRL